MPVTLARAQTQRVKDRTAGRPLLRVTGPNEGRYFWIDHGKQGSLQTAWQMARLVREDTIRDEGLQRWAANLIIKAGLDSHSHKRDVLDVLFRYVQALAYINDPAGSFDSVSSARTTLAKGMGDCDDLSVLLATLMALLGFKPRFVLARMKADSKGFDHVYVDTVLPTGERIALDPCSRRHTMGWESPAFIERLTFPIFSMALTSLGDAMQGALTGAAIGLNFVPVVGPLLSQLVGPIAGLFSRKQQRAEEATRDEWKDQVYQGLQTIEAAVNSCKITPQQGIAAARELIDQFYTACDGFTKKSVAASCRNFESQDVPGGAQEGAFKTRTARIGAAGGSCKTVSGLGGSGGAGGIAGGGDIGGFPIWLLLAGGVVVFIMMRG